MNFLKLFSLVTYLPVIDIPFAPGGKPLIRHASYRGLTFLCVIVIALGVFAYFYFVSWYQRHPVLGKIAVVLAGLWGLRQAARFIRALCDDPYTRTQPYKRG